MQPKGWGVAMLGGPHFVSEKKRPRWVKIEREG